jgi:pyruvate-formate lyase-activating enzyme
MASRGLVELQSLSGTLSPNPFQDGCSALAPALIAANVACSALSWTLADTEDNIEATAGFLKSLGHDSITLLKYHKLYEAKAKRLGLLDEERRVHQQSRRHRPFRCESNSALTGWLGRTARPP